MAGLRRHQMEKAEKKAARLVKYVEAPPSIRARALAMSREDQYMDMNDIETYIEHTLGIVTEDIGDRTKAVGPALKLMELKARLATEGSTEEDSVDDAVKALIQKARQLDSE